ncbi:MAG TPA: hypothetical protein PKE63_05775 [Lacibacter sp.]|nr:hypothetical protein [Lacibacter sp.]HMO88255.1 hypothetical protein [Lacibacter sp.]HMP86766.1 hypothetical protein [Lacibacter sp.]
MNEISFTHLAKRPACATVLLSLRWGRKLLVVCLIFNGVFTVGLEVIMGERTIAAMELRANPKAFSITLLQEEGMVALCNIFYFKISPLLSFTKMLRLPRYGFTWQSLLL